MSVGLRDTLVVPPAAVAGYELPTIPIGSFNLQVLAGTSDPYLKITTVDPWTLKEVQMKTPPVKKTLNPVWNFTIHSWITVVPFVVKIDVYDKNDLVSDSFMGCFQIDCSIEHDFHMDQWVQLFARPGKRDKKVKGEIHVICSATFLRNFNPLDQKIWPQECMVTIEPTPGVCRVDVMGPIHDLALLSMVKDARIRRLPKKLFSPLHTTEPLGWSIKVTDLPSAADKLGYKYHWKHDYLYEVCVHLLEKFTEYGFEIKQGDHMHCINPAGPWFYDRALLMVKSASLVNLHPFCRYIAVQRYSLEDLRIEIIGELDPGTLAFLGQHFAYDQLKDPFTGSVVLTSLFFPDSSHRFSVFPAGNGTYRTEAHQQLMITILSLLHQTGFLYLTVWGDLHLMVRDNDFHSRGIVPLPHNFMIADPIFTSLSVSPHINIYGVDMEILTGVVYHANSSARPPILELIPVRDNNQHVAYHRLRSLQNLTAGTGDNQVKIKRNQTIFHNIFLEVVTVICDRGGYRPVGAFGGFGIMLSKPMGSFPTGWFCQNVLLDPGFTRLTQAMCIEIRGNIEFNEVAAATGAVGFSQIIEESDSGTGRLCWIAPLDRTDPKQTSMSHKDSAALDMNKHEFHISKLFSFFQNELSFEAVAQIGVESILFQRVPPGTVPRCRYIFVDANFVLGSDIDLEVCGDIDGDEVAAAASHAGISQPVPIIDPTNPTVVWGYQMKMIGLKVISGDHETVHRLNTHWKFIWIKFVNKLAEFGWQYKMAANPGNHRIAVFYQPLQIIVTESTTVYH